MTGYYLRPSIIDAALSLKEWIAVKNYHIEVNVTF